MQKELTNKMSARQGFIHAVEKAGIKMQYYLDTRDESYMDMAISYVRAANVLLKEMGDEIE